MKKFKEGDKVRLKSGSPAMTIVEIINDPKNSNNYDCHCVWYEDSQIKCADINYTALEICE